ncbi:MAG: DUF2167 domain-containing protein [Nitrospinota bacterium]|nr:DUF2167 domain-containing protein [Nitrospinota bacterium]
MKNLYTLIAVLMIVGMAPVAQAVNPAIPVTQQAINENIISLPWKYELKQYSLEQSNSTFNLSKGYSLLMGDAARRYDRITQGTEEDPNTEALVFNHKTGVQLILNYHPTGYVSLEDWEKLDANILMQEISDNAKKINAQRIKNNIPPLRIGGWLQKPRLNQDNHSVSWVFDVIDGEETTVNAVSIKLGRKGYEKITWVSTYDNYLKSMDAMVFLVDQHKFKEGHRYADYSMGDQIAAFGVASLVAVTAGGNPPKGGLAALYAGLVAIGKKLLVPVLIALGALEIYCRKMFRRKNDPLPEDPLYI